MFRIFLFISLLIGALQLTNAQEFNGGLYGGLVASQLDGDTFGGYNKAGLISGAYVNRFIDKKLALQFGLRYIQKGSRKADNETGIDYRSQLHYVEMPFTVRYFHYKKVNFEAGLALAYLIKGLESISGSDLAESQYPFNKFEISGIAGINYEFSKKISVAGMFQYSVSQVRGYSSKYSSFLRKGQYNNIVYFTLNYKLSSWR
ncbi:MAG: PorT family protein [Salinivirgaceae bacterium]|nr:PorT family protein [Salinivirgaceae bacterium]